MAGTLWPVPYISNYSYGSEDGPALVASKHIDTCVAKIRTFKELAKIIQRNFVLLQNPPHGKRSYLEFPSTNSTLKLEPVRFRDTTLIDFLLNANLDDSKEISIRKVVIVDEEKEETSLPIENGIYLEYVYLFILFFKTYYIPKYERLYSVLKTGFSHKSTFLTSTKKITDVILGTTYWNIHSDFMSCLDNEQDTEDRDKRMVLWPGRAVSTLPNDITFVMKVKTATKAARTFDHYGGYRRKRSGRKRSKRSTKRRSSRAKKTRRAQ
jgi:hypothetical protein